MGVVDVCLYASAVTFVCMEKFQGKIWAQLHV